MWTMNSFPSGKRPNEVMKSGPEKLPRIGFALLAGLSIFWGLSWPNMKIALGEIPPWTFRTLCLFFGGFGILGLAKANGWALTIPSAELRPLILVALFNITGWHLCSAYGLICMNAGRAAIIAYTMPIWTSILGSFILGERLTLSRLLGLFFGMIGLFILIGPDMKAISSAPLGMVFMLGASLSWAAGTVFIKYFRWTMPTAVFAGWQEVLGGIPIIIGALIFEPITSISQVSWQGALATVYIIILPMTLCYWAWVKIVQIFPSNVAAIGTLVIPVIGVFSSGLLLGEPIGFREVASLILVLMALAIGVVKPKDF
jgi:drug/metabolite transporter (DMT)-like permease